MKKDKLIVLSFGWDFEKNPIVFKSNKFEKFKKISRTGSLKYDFKKPVYIKKEMFDNYSINQVIDLHIMVFTNEDYNERTVLMTFIEMYASNVREIIKSKQEHLLLLEEKYNQL